jgi:hypothetical protein
MWRWLEGSGGEIGDGFWKGGGCFGGGWYSGAVGGLGEVVFELLDLWVVVRGDVSQYVPLRA